MEEKQRKETAYDISPHSFVDISKSLVETRLVNERVLPDRPRTAHSLLVVVLVPVLDLLRYGPIQTLSDTDRSRPDSVVPGPTGSNIFLFFVF